MKEWLRLPSTSKKTLLSTAVLIFACHLGIDICTPSLPNMVHSFNSTKDILQLTITCYILGSSLAIALWGPLSDYYGRKPILISGAFIIIITSTLAVFTKRIEVFLLLRFFQGAGSGASHCLGRVVAADVLNKEELAVIGATMGLITGMAPMIAPLIGGYMEVSVGWQGSFVAYATLTFLALSIFLFLFTESNTNRTKHMNLLELYTTLLSNNNFILLAILQGMILSILNCSIAVAPFLVQGEMGKSPIYFGWIMTYCAGCQLFSKMISPALIRRYSVYGLHQFGWHLLSFAALILLSRLYNPSEVMFIIGIGSAFLSIHFIFPYVFTEAYTLKHVNAGVISSGLVGIGLLISYVLSSIVAIIPYEGTGLLGITFLCLGLSGIQIAKRVNNSLGYEQ